MARKVERFPDLPNQSRYPWDEWLDGGIWELAPGEDFKGKPATFRSVAIGQAKKRGGKAKTRLLRGKDGQPDRMYLQFRRDGDTAQTPQEHLPIGS